MDDPELSKFKTEIDLRLFAASQGYELDRKESWSSSAVMRHPNNDKIVITRNAADGHYVYFSFRDEADNGTIIDFTQRRLGLSLGATRIELRAFMGLPVPSLAPYPPLGRVAKDRIRVRDLACIPDDHRNGHGLTQRTTQGKEDTGEKPAPGIG